MDNHDYIRRILAKAEFTGNFQDTYPTAQIHALIDTVPAEDVQPVVHGKWLHGKETAREYVGNALVGIFYENFLCSCCGYIIDDRQYTKITYKYCPNCGARMDLEDDERMMEDNDNV